MLSAVHLLPPATTSPTVLKSDADTTAAVGTVVVSGYSPSVSTLPDGNVVTIGGEYPWADSATITLTKTAALSLRVPCWSANATVVVGAATPRTAPACAFFNLSSVVGGATVNITFANEIKTCECCPAWHPSYCAIGLALSPIDPNVELNS